MWLSARSVPDFLMEVMTRLLDAPRGQQRSTSTAPHASAGIGTNAHPDSRRGQEALLVWCDGGTEEVDSVINTKAVLERVQANEIKKDNEGG